MARTVQSAESGQVRAAKRSMGVGVDKGVFGVSAALAVAFVVVGVTNPDRLSTVSSSMLGWVTSNLGWAFVLAAGFFLGFSAFLALSRYGTVKLGADDDKPAFSTFSWVSMMFATGMGIGLMFYGVAEPLTHLNAPPLGLARAGSPDAAQLSMEYSFFHWGLHAWSMYAVIGLAIAYFSFRRGYGCRISSALRPLLGDRADGNAGRAVDILAIFATLFGSATSLGLGALQIAGGLRDVAGVDAGNPWVPTLVILVLTLCFVASAVSGVERGIKWLSNANAVAAALLCVFLFVVGPTVFILGTFTESAGGYLAHLPSMSFRVGVFDDEATWLHAWTIFYWAWWISWTPFVGMFIARISRGRTIREFVTYVVAVPSLVGMVWFSVFGGAGINLQHSGAADLRPELKEGPEFALFAMLREYPLAMVTIALAVFLVAIFFITGADGASIVMGILSQRGEAEPHRWLVVFWGGATGAIAALLLYADGLSGLQTLVILVAAPFMVVLLAMCLALIRSLRSEFAPPSEHPAEPTLGTPAAPARRVPEE